MPSLEEVQDSQCPSKLVSQQQQRHQSISSSSSSSSSDSQSAMISDTKSVGSSYTHSSGSSQSGEATTGTGSIPSVSPPVQLDLTSDIQSVLDGTKFEDIAASLLSSLGLEDKTPLAQEPMPVTRAPRLPPTSQLSDSGQSSTGEFSLEGSPIIAAGYYFQQQQQQQFAYHPGQSQELTVHDPAAIYSASFDLGFSETDDPRALSQNVTENVPVPSSEHVAEIVGRQGCKIKALRAKTNTYIKTPVRGEDPMFVVTGRPQDVEAAKLEILNAADHFTQIRASRRHSQGGVPAPGHITAYVRVPYRVVGLVVGPKGATIKRIQQDTHTYIITPSREREPIFEVTGMPDNVERARREIETHIYTRTGNLPISTGYDPYHHSPLCPPALPNGQTEEESALQNGSVGTWNAAEITQQHMQQPISKPSSCMSYGGGSAASSGAYTTPSTANPLQSLSHEAAGFTSLLTQLKAVAQQGNVGAAPQGYTAWSTGTWANTQTAQMGPDDAARNAFNMASGCHDQVLGSLNFGKPTESVW